MRWLIIVFIILSGLLEVKSQEVIDYYFYDGKLRVNCVDVDFEIEVYSQNIVKISSFSKDETKADSSYVVIKKPEVITYSIFEDSDFISIATDSMSLSISLDTFGIDFRRKNKILSRQIKNSFFRAYDISGCYFGLKEDEGIYGLGLKAVDINRRNLETILHNQNVFGYEHGESWLNSNVPFIMSSEKYAIFVDNHALHYFDADLSVKNTIKYNVNHGELNYFIIVGDSYSGLLQSYYDLTGKQPLLPRWACGFILSKVSFQSQNNLMAIVDKMEEYDYPMDALVFDYSWFGYAENMGNFTWDKAAYPQPKKMISELKDRGINTILISEPFVAKTSINYNDAVQKNLFPKYANGELPTVKILGADVVLLDIYKKSTKEWVWNKYLQRTTEGVAGWWIDLIEPEFHANNWFHEIGNSRDNHNIYSLVWAQNLFENYKNTFPDQRPFLMYRAGWAGIQRYGAILLCGDVARSWGGLKAQVPGMLGMQMSGLPIFTTDIGGFAGGWNINSELYIRWFQFGTFTPVMRLHMGGTALVEPFHHDIKTQNIIRDYIKLRYRLIPYNYTLYWENSKSGLPPARPMNFYYNDLKFSNINDQYFWGKNFLIAPVVDTNIRMRDVLLPQGNWFNYRTKEMVNGNKIITVDAPIDNIPVFIRSGSFIPTIPQINNTKEYSTDTLIIEYYPDLENPVTDYTMYDDDGTTPDANLKGEFQLLKFKGIVSSDSIYIEQNSEGNYPNNPQTREIYLKIYNFKMNNFLVKVNNEFITKAASQVIYGTLSQAYLFNTEDNFLEIHYSAINFGNEIIIINNLNNIDESEHTATIDIFPVPGKDILNLKIKNFYNGKYKLNIYNIKGQSIIDEFELTIIENHYNYQFELNKFPNLNTNGIYFLQIEGENQKKTIKFSVER